MKDQVKDVCAFLYQNDRGNGWEIAAIEGDEPRLRRDGNNQLTTVYVQPDCELQLFLNSNFSPNEPMILKNKDATEKRFNILDVDRYWNDKVSSYKCHCGHQG